MVTAEISNAAHDAAAGVRDAGEALAPLVEHLRDSCMFVHDDMRVGFLNAAARRGLLIRGFDPTAFAGSNLWQFLNYAPEVSSRQAIEVAMRTRVPTNFTTKGGEGEVWYEVDVVPLDGGSLIYYRDASARSGAEVARVTSERLLHMTEERLRVVLNEAPVAVIVAGTDLRVLLWNPAAEAMFQWTSAEIVGQPLPIVPDEELASHLALRARHAAGESVKAHPARRRRKDGTVIDVQVSSAPYKDSAGNVVGVMAMISDVTTHRKLEAQLRMAQKMEAVGLLAGGIAHDFNNLLTAIKGFTSLLQMSLDESGQTSEFLGEINKAADRAAALTAQLLAFSRRQLLRPEPLDLNMRVNDLERMLRLLLREDGQLILGLDPAIGHVLADPGQIEQVILNLVVNARDAIRGRPGGVVRITTSNAELHDQFANWGVQEAPGSYVRLDVIDNGMGMDRATQARIFDPFFTTKEPGQGTGLGLATVFGIVKQSGGYIWVSSAPDQGAAFSVYLPRAQAKARVSGAAAATDAAGRELVLVVEDEESVRRVACRALELHGYGILEAADGTAALALASANDVDLLLTDVMMPGMLGPQLAAELRRRKPDMPVLFMSGHSDEIVRDGLLDHNVPFIAKPFTPAQLAHKVRAALDQAKQADKA